MAGVLQGVFSGHDDPRDPTRTTSSMSMSIIKEKKSIERAITKNKF